MPIRDIKDRRRAGTLILLYTVFLALGVFFLAELFSKREAKLKESDHSASPLGSPTPSPAEFDRASFPRTPEGQAPMWEQLIKLREANPNWDWQRPIVFYGAVVDQENRPVAGADVFLQWSAVGATPERHMFTGADGRFEVGNITGKRLLVRVAKEGYHDGPIPRGSFEYADGDADIFHIPDPAKPVIFRLRQRRGEEPMYLWVASASIPTDGTKIGFDVEKGKFAGVGDIQFSFVRWNESAVKVFDYKISITTPEGGGVSETHDGMMFDPPVDGYTAVWEETQIVGTQGYKAAKLLRFYLKTASGKFAAVEMNVNQTARPEAQVDLIGYYNPSGSRNLEYNDDLRINKR